MRNTSTYTYALLAVSEAAYNEIFSRLEDAGYQDQFHDNEETPGFPAIDMHGIALVMETLSNHTNDKKSSGSPCRACEGLGVRRAYKIDLGDLCPNCGESVPCHCDRCHDCGKNIGYETEFSEHSKVCPALCQHCHGSKIDPVKLVCYLCKKPIRGKIFYQGNSIAHPAHKKCLITIKPSKRHGGGI